jgi:hypothetical protein
MPLLTDLAALQAHVAALQWRNAEISRVITDALCAVDELTGEPFQDLLAEVRDIAAEPLPGGGAKPAQSGQKP